MVYNRPDTSCSMAPETNCCKLCNSCNTIKTRWGVNSVNDDTTSQDRILYSADEQKRKLIQWLLNGGFSFDPQYDAIGNEVLFSQARRRADLLVLSDSFHAIEIKGDSDNLTKLPEQLADYRITFDKVSVATTPKHIRRVRKIIPASVGIILVEAPDIEIIRKASLNRRLDKNSLLMFLDKKNLLRLLTTKNRLLSVGEMRNMIAQKATTEMIRKVAYMRLHGIYSKLSQRFFSEIKGYPLLLDEIRSLSASVAAPTSLTESNTEE